MYGKNVLTNKFPEKNVNNHFLVQYLPKVEAVNKVKKASFLKLKECFLLLNKILMKFNNNNNNN